MILKTSTSTYPPDGANTSYHRWSPLMSSSHAMSLFQISPCNNHCIVNGSTERRQIAQIRTTMESKELIGQGLEMWRLGFFFLSSFSVAGRF